VGVKSRRASGIFGQSIALSEKQDFVQGSFRIARFDNQPVLTTGFDS
jgi:hypothetical protein